MSAGAATRYQKSFRIIVHVSSACWLMFSNTPVASSIPIRLDPP
jgi:hypothetical protein